MASRRPIVLPRVPDPATRTIYATIPPRVDYALTALGRHTAPGQKLEAVRTRLLPENAVAMASAVDLFKRRTDAPLVFLGLELELPRALVVVLGVEPEPFLEITATFADEAEARRWEATFPALKSKLRTNPYVVLGGISPLVSRLTSTREGSEVRLRLTATEEETVRLLQLAASALPG